MADSKTNVGGVIAQGIETLGAVVSSQNQAQTAASQAQAATAAASQAQAAAAAESARTQKTLLIGGGIVGGLVLVGLLARR
ncbi:hypothetical protein L6R53_13995 [Myxococcota bacterium]|nr:hypothetical protein [Myxococcota bacterium]